MNCAANTWNHPDVGNLGHDVGDGQIADHDLLPLNELVGCRCRGRRPRQVVLERVMLIMMALSLSSYHFIPSRPGLPDLLIHQWHKSSKPPEKEEPL